MSPQVVSLGQEDRQDHLCGAADGDRQTDRQTRTHTHTHSAGFPRFPLDTLICQAAGTNHLLHNVREPPPCTSPPPPNDSAMENVCQPSEEEKSSDKRKRVQVNLNI